MQDELDELDRLIEEFPDTAFGPSSIQAVWRKTASILRQLDSRLPLK
jgi:hypothetical protein